ncbi:FAD-binding protein [Natronorubrum daqingense]|uniref:succinate dehydrogenase n=1 Tax=Natronorubrum daqingense TaxID=588898 RepID=A0A1N6Z7B1_9EURY|nr:FAD-binding protein [Natronorubrum daqingense]APX95437.1 succinate dehydrogenase [Natronorubrum daqingense]SIR22685.1 succinate dehydrogenase / fumarate reductase flavoprotein subunit [Natronorubrum daqingense]
MYEHDVIVVGAGGAGLRAAVAADEAGADVALVSKLHPVRSHTGAAEGGINAALQEGDDWELHAYDTMKGSDYLGDAPAVETLAQDAPEDTIKLEHWGMPFSREEDGRVSQRPFGGLSYPRTTYAGAETGHHLLHVMYEQVVKRGIQVYDEWYVMDLAVSDEDDPNERDCHGIVAYDVQTGNIEGFKANDGVVLATGGPGQAFDHTTNAVSCTGDGHAMAYRAGAPLEDMEFIQFHPTSLPSTGVLISEGVRGEGGILYNNDGERFMFEHGYANNSGELASRDVVARAELTEVQEGRGVEDEYVHLDMRHLGEERILDRLENILHLAEDFEGVDGLIEPMPVKPGQHYAMGGIEVDENGQTCIDGLYAAGECACVSVHGGNRLGGNALPELIVFGKRAGYHAAGKDLGEPEIRTGYGDDVEDETDTELPVQPGAAGLGTTDDVAADGGERTDGSRSSSEARSDGGVVADADGVLEQTVEDARGHVDSLMDKDTGVQHAEIRQKLQNAMTDYVNVFRTEEGVKKALTLIRECREEYQDVYVDDPSTTFNTDLQQTIETRNLIDVAETIALGALVRNEFRGAHWRQENQTRDDENWLKHTLISWEDGEPNIFYRPVILEGEEKTYEPKVRSY